VQCKFNLVFAVQAAGPDFLTDNSGDIHKVTTTELL